MFKDSVNILKKIIPAKRMNPDNKNSFFAVSIGIPPEINLASNFDVVGRIDEEFDMILSAMSASTTVCRFEKIDNFSVVYFFSTTVRKRRGQLIKLCEKFLKGYECNVDAITKGIFLGTIEKFKKYPDYKGVVDPNITNYYKGEDIEVFNDSGNWRPWQKQVYEMFFHKGGTFKKPDPRKIILLYDPEGNTGKSSFFKWLYFRYSLDL